MKKILLLHLFTCAFLTVAGAEGAGARQPAAESTNTSAAQATELATQSPSAVPLREMRAVWLTTIGGLDWPHTYSQSASTAATQQQELCDILDQLAAAGTNTVLLQTRVRGTTIYPSDNEPWDGCLSGHPGMSPGYDALEFAVDECHKRGMKLHAWVVAIPVGKWDGAGCRALRKTHPKLIKRIGNEGYMNPEQSGTADYIAALCRDLTERYDIDGIHLDYIRYPETWKPIRNKDAARGNITRIVRKVYSEVKAAKPWVMLSCAPVGKYADTRRTSSRGWNARDAVCQDAALWLQEGVMDCIFPMMYFRGDNFYPFAIDWKERAAGRLVVPGLGIYFLSPREKDWPLADITREMHVLRQYGMGTCLFRSKFLTDNTKGLYDYTREVFSPLPSLQPPMTWHGVQKPSAPTAVTLRRTADGDMRLSWRAPENGAQDGTKATQYNVYGSDRLPVDIRDASNLLAANLTQTHITMPGTTRIRHFAVTATDRYGNESEGIGNADSRIKNREAVASRRQGQSGNAELGANTVLQLPSHSDVTEGQLITVSSLQGSTLRSAFARRGDDGRLCIETTLLTPGHYLLHVIGRKGHRHKLGTVTVPLDF